VLTVADFCIWHGRGTNLSRRQSATAPGAPTKKARMCLAAPPPTFTTLPMPSARASDDSWHVLLSPQLGKLRASGPAPGLTCGGAVSAHGGRSAGSPVLPVVPAGSGTRLACLHGRRASGFRATNSKRSAA
jgi:hypothetical protein